MYRVAIIGSENSHADAFIRILNGADGNASYGDVKVVAVGGNYPEANQRLMDKYGLEFIADDYAAAAKKVDAAMITARDGKFHAEMAIPFIDAGLPVFIDKPFTSDSAEALQLIARARDKKVPLCGGSSVKLAYDALMLKSKAESGSVRGGFVTAPLSMKNEYGNFYFYSAHLAETMLEIFGYNPISVTAETRNDCVYATVDYGDFMVSNSYINGGTKYHATVIKDSEIFSRELDISIAYKHECDEFVNMLRTGHMSHSYLQLAAPVFVLNAVYKAYTTGTKQEIKIPQSF